MCEGIPWTDFLFWMVTVIALYYSVIGYLYRKELLQWLERKSGKE